jgi:hypothetical protein
MPLQVVRVPDDDGTIPIRELRERQLAEVVQWPDWPVSVDQVVIRQLGSIVGITLALLCSSIPQSNGIRVRILPNGTQFVLHDNE